MISAKPAALAALLLLQAAAAATDAPPVAQPQYLRTMRALTVPAGSGQACAVLDAPIFPHAAPSLIDLRIFPVQTSAPDQAAAATPQAPAPHEIPYAVTLSESVSQETAGAQVRNLGMGAGPGHTIVFDLAMPARPYTSVTLNLDPALHDFLATATVTAYDTDPAARDTHGHSVLFGSFTLFDLTAQRLARSTTLPLPESTFPYLHIALSLSVAPGSQTTPAEFVPSIVQGAEVPPSREAQAIYTTVAETAALTTSGRQTIAKLEVPARVPVERVEFALAPSFKANFSRSVRVTATTQPPPKSQSQSDADADSRPPVPEVLTGSILRVRTTQAGRDINTEQLAVPAVLGANLQRPATVEVAIENGDDRPLPIAAVRLQMRQRKLCFDASAAVTGRLALYYGDSALSAPVYDYERLFTAADKPLAVALGPELPNPAFTPRPAAPLSFTERHPAVLWIALLAVICTLGLVALRSSKDVAG
jgi:hypothetical protein